MPSRRVAKLSIAAVCLSSSAGPLSVNGFTISSPASTTAGLAPNNKIRRQPASQLYSEQSDGSSSSNSSDESSPPVSMFFADDTSNDLLVQDNTAKFGDSVPFKAGAGKASFGESVPLKRPSTTNTADSSSTDALIMTDNTNFMEAEPQAETPSELDAMRKRNFGVAVASIVFAFSSYAWQFTHPITPVQLLATMQSNSAPLTSIGTNGKPTVVDFWAPWCENCKQAAPTLQKLEEDYKDQVNFVMINGDAPAAWPLIERFGVDAIPHMALISAEGDVETALIGPIPKRVLEADLNALLANAKIPAATAAAVEGEGATATAATQKQELPFKMLDAFANQPQLRRVQFTSEP